MASTPMDALYEEGKSLREKCPRKSHAVWKAPNDRQNLLRLLEESDKGRIPRLIPMRHTFVAKTDTDTVDVPPAATTMIARFLLAVSLALSVGCATTKQLQAAPPTKVSGPKLTPQEKAQRIEHLLAMRERTRADLYALKPAAKAEVEKAVGYAVFDVNGYYLLFVEEHGHGVLTDNATGQVTYMTTERVGEGLAFGYADFRLVLLFHSKQFMDKFKRVGADVSGDAGIVAKSRSGLGVDAEYSASFDPELKLYQVTDKGLLLQAEWGVTGFLPDGDLN
jgi:lipid-binding SYLF domain-containing protein